MNQFELFVSSQKAILNNRASRVFSAMIRMLTCSLRFIHTKPSLSLLFLTQPLNFESPELQGVYL